MKIYRKHAVLTLSTVEERKRVFIEVTPAIRGIIDRKHEVGEELFDYENSIRRGFYPLDMLIASFKLLRIADGYDLVLEKFRDVPRQDYSPTASKDSLFIKPDGAGVTISITHGTVHRSITVTKEETYAIGMWFQFQAQKFIIQ